MIAVKDTTKKPIVQSVERAYRILKCFEENEYLRITEISNLTELHKSTAYGLVNTLKELRILEQDTKTGMYKLGLELFKLGAHVNINLRNIVSPYIDSLVVETQETVNLVVREGDSILYIEKKESPHSMRICTNLGQLVPLYCTAGGKAILAFLDPQDTEEILHRTEFKRYTANTLMTVNDVMADIEEVREKGYAVDREELEYGLTCVGIPLFNKKNCPIGAISVSGPTTRMSYKLTKNIAEKMMNYSKQITDKL